MRSDQNNEVWLYAWLGVLYHTSTSDQNNRVWVCTCGLLYCHAQEAAVYPTNFTSTSLCIAHLKIFTTESWCAILKSYTNQNNCDSSPDGEHHAQPTKCRRRWQASWHEELDNWRKWTLHWKYLLWHTSHLCLAHFCLAQVKIHLPTSTIPYCSQIFFSK